MTFNDHVIFLSPFLNHSSIAGHFGCCHVLCFGIWGVFACQLHCKKYLCALLSDNP